MAEEIVDKAVDIQLEKILDKVLNEDDDVVQKNKSGSMEQEAGVVWTSLGPLPRWVPGPTTWWAPGTTRLALHGI
jgi:hypothetical protein